jgi:hypothetical protein
MRPVEPIQRSVKQCPELLSHRKVCSLGWSSYLSFLPPVSSAERKCEVHRAPAGSLNVTGRNRGLQGDPSWLGVIFADGGGVWNTEKSGRDEPAWSPVARCLAS